MKLSKPLSALILIASALLLNGVRSASADPPKPTPWTIPQSHREAATEEKPTDTQTDQTSANRHGADTFALATPNGPAESRPTASDTRRTSEEERHDRREESLEQNLVCLTAILAGIEVLTLIIFLFTMIANIRAANAAKTSADAALASSEVSTMALHSNRPVLIFNRAHPRSENWDGDKPLIGAEIYFKNIGHSPALIANARTGLTVEHCRPYAFAPSDKLLRFPARVLDRVIAEEFVGSIDSGNELQLSKEERQRIGAGEWTIVFSGIVSYRDPALSREYWIEFCQFYEPPRPGYLQGHFVVGPSDLQKAS